MTPPMGNLQSCFVDNSFPRKCDSRLPPLRFSQLVLSKAFALSSLGRLSRTNGITACQTIERGLQFICSQNISEVFQIRFCRRLVYKKCSQLTKCQLDIHSPTCLVCQVLHKLACHNTLACFHLATQF